MNPYSLRKTLRALEIARTNRLPVMNLVESGGADLPTQADLFVPAGRIFHELTELSGAGHPHRSAGVRQLHRGRRLRARHVRLRGPGGRAGQGVPRRPAAGQDGHRRGGRRRVARRRRDALAHLGAVGLLRRRRARRDPHRPGDHARINWRKPGRAAGAGREPQYDPDEILGIVSADLKVPFDPREILARVVDGSELRRVQAALRHLAGDRLGADPRLPGRRAGQPPRRAVQRGGQEGHASSSCWPTRPTRRWSSCRTPPATWSAPATSRAASSRTAPR